MSNKPVTEKQILNAIERYKRQLCDSPKVSLTKFQHMQTALTGCQYLVNDLFGSPRKKVFAMSK